MVQLQLNDFEDILTRYSDYIRFICVSTRSVCNGTHIQRTKSDYIRCEMDRINQFSHENFDFVYAVHSFWSRGVKAFSKVSPQALKDLSSARNKEIPSIIKNLEHSARFIDGETSPNCNQTLLDFSGVLSSVNYSYNPVQTSPNQLMVRSVMITPSRVILLPKMMIPNNRLLKKFGTEFAIRVMLIDDNGEPLSYITNPDVPGIYDSWICQKLEKGRVNKFIFNNG